MSFESFTIKSIDNWEKLLNLICTLENALRARGAINEIRK